MKIHIITVGKPKLDYAAQGWDLYVKRLGRYHEVKVTHLADKYAYDAKKIQEVIGGSTAVVLEIEGTQYSSEQLAKFLIDRELEAKGLSFVIGGPEGLPDSIRSDARYQWSLGKHTLPHDLAMVSLAEALYRASTINAGQPYHK